MTSIATNIPAVRVQYHGARNETAQIQATERLSGGKRINQASDDAAGMFVAQRIKVSIRGMERAISNSQDGLGLVSTAESAINEIRNIVLRMRELSVQMANGVYLDSPDRGFAQAEIDQLLQQVDMIAQNANFNGLALLDGSFQNMAIHAGSSAEERISFSFGNRTTSGLGIAGLSIGTQSNAKAAMNSLETALAKLSDDLSLAGAYQNRLKHNISLLGSTKRYNEIAFGRIMDADMAAEATALSRAQVLAQANTAMLAQSNQALSTVLTLFN